MAVHVAALEGAAAAALPDGGEEDDLRADDLRAWLGAAAPPAPAAARDHGWMRRHGEALAAKVELAHRWLSMHESLAAKGGDQPMSKAERIFNDMLWEQATCDGDLPEATILELTSPPPAVVAAWR